MGTNAAKAIRDLVQGTGRIHSKGTKVTSKRVNAISDADWKERMENRLKRADQSNKGELTPSFKYFMKGASAKLVLGCLNADGVIDTRKYNAQKAEIVKAELAKFVTDGFGKAELDVIKDSISTEYDRARLGFTMWYEHYKAKGFDPQRLYEMAGSEKVAEKVS